MRPVLPHRDSCPCLRFQIAAPWLRIRNRALAVCLASESSFPNRRADPVYQDIRQAEELAQAEPPGSRTKIHSRTARSAICARHTRECPPVFVEHQWELLPVVE